jgi:hypothetical protein
VEQTNGKSGDTLNLGDAELLARMNIFPQLDHITLAKLAAYCGNLLQASQRNQRGSELRE